MKTEQLWYRMPANSHELPSVIAMRKKLGWEGFGIYVGILGLLRSSKDGSLPTDFDSFGWHLRCPNGIVKSVIMNFGLFTISEDGTRFFDQDLIDEMKQYQSALDERREAGRRSAERRWGAKTDQNSNGDATSEPDPSAKTTEKQAKIMGDPSKIVTAVTDFDAINKQIKKETDNTSYCFRGTPDGVVLPRTEIQEDYFNQLDERWQAIVMRWYAHKKEMSPKLKGLASIKKQVELLLEMSEGNADYAEAIVEYSVKQGYAGLYKPAQGRGDKVTKPSKKKEVKYSNDTWENSEVSLPRVELTIDENGNPCPF